MTEPNRPLANAGVEARREVLDHAVLRRVDARVAARATLRLPAAPALLDHYTQMLASTFAAIGRPLSSDEHQHMRHVLETKLREAFTRSPHSWLTIAYKTDPPPAATLTYRIHVEHSSMNDEYTQWVQTREGPLFGAYADAKVMAVARALGDRAACTSPRDRLVAIDVGAGTGRNAVYLAEAGWEVTALEKSPALAEILARTVHQQQPRISVLAGDIVDPAVDLAGEAFDLAVVSEVVSSHFRSPMELRALFVRLAEILRPAGEAVINVFLADEGYEPGALAVEASQLLWSPLFTRAQLARAVDDLPLTLVSDENALDYEKENLPPNAWPPTSWYAHWASGSDLFALEERSPPIQLRWLVFRRT